MNFTSLRILHVLLLRCTFMLKLTLINRLLIALSQSYLKKHELIDHVTLSFDLPKTTSFLVYPKIIPYTKFEYFGIIRFWVMLWTNRQTDKQTNIWSRTCYPRRPTLSAIWLINWLTDWWLPRHVRCCCCMLSSRWRDTDGVPSNADTICTWHGPPRSLVARWRQQVAAKVRLRIRSQQRPPGQISHERFVFKQSLHAHKDAKTPKQWL